MHNACRPDGAEHMRPRVQRGAAGQNERPPEAGVAVYVRGPSGRVAIAPIYDDTDRLSPRGGQPPSPVLRTLPLTGSDSVNWSPSRCSAPHGRATTSKNSIR